MKYKLYKSLAIGSLIALAGCQDFEEMNTNPYAPVYDPTVIGGTAQGIDIDYTLSDDALKSLQAVESAAGATFANFLYEGLYNDFQVTTDLTHNVYAAYTGSNAFLNSSPAYSYTDGYSANRWKHFYDDRTMSEYSQLLKIFWFCNKDYYHNAFYITRIYYAFLMSGQTDTYGDIPTQYYVKGALPPEENVAYTKQEDVYKIIFQLLDQAITALHNPPTGGSLYKFTSSQDLCYKGDVNAWMRFANTLRLRLALRVSNANPALAKEQGEKALKDPAGLMKGQEDNMKLVPKRQYITGGNENIFALMFSWGACDVLPKEMEWAYKNQSLKSDIEADGFVAKVSDDVDAEGNILSNTVFGKDDTKYNEKSANCYLDPRCEILWFRPSPFIELSSSSGIKESNKDFGGFRNGLKEIGPKYTTVYSPMRCDLNSDEMNPKVWWNMAREIVWMGYSESLFLKAEAALRGWTGVNQSPKEYYEQGIRASMNYYKIDADSEGQEKINNYISSLQGIATFTGGSKEAQLEQIITQKWLAVFPNGNEGWAEVRRTDYPRYLLLPRYGNSSNGSVENTKLIKRVSYPNSESRNTLKPNYTQGDKVWWDVADTMDDNGKWQTPNNFR